MSSRSGGPQRESLLRLAARVVATLLIPVGLAWAGLAFVGHSLLANELCTDTGGCREPRVLETVVLDMTAALGLAATWVTIMLGFRFGRHGTHLRRFVGSISVVALLIVVWLAEARSF